MIKVEFYFDFLSPYSYLAWTQIKKLNLDLEFYPVALPNVIGHYETKGPGQIKPKRDYLTRDLLRYKTLHSIPFKFPVNLPFNSLYALRLCMNSLWANKNDQFKLIDLFFKFAWEQGEDLGNSDSIEKLLAENGFDASDLMNKISSKEIKLELRSNIERALQNGAFGVPTMVVVNSNVNSKELFWGNDSIEYLKMYLKGEDPLPTIEYQDFLTNHPM